MNPLPQSVLRWAVIVGVLVAIVGQLAGDSMTPLIARIVEWVTLIGLLAAVLMFTGSASSQQAEIETALKFTVVKVNILFVVAAVGTVILTGGLMGIDAELLKLFATGAFLVAKDVLQSDHGT